MREIKFRAWDEDHFVFMDEGPTEYQWIFDENGFSIEYFDADQCKIVSGELCEFAGWVPCRNAIFEQFTGLRDCKRTEEYPEGQKIFEGDIIKYITFDCIATVVYSAPHFGGLDEDGLHAIGGYEVEVIGNIHENPKLLKGE